MRQREKTEKRSGRERGGEKSVYMHIYIYIYTYIYKGVRKVLSEPMLHAQADADKVDKWSAKAARLRLVTPSLP